MKWPQVFGMVVHHLQSNVSVCFTKHLWSFQLSDWRNSEIVRTGRIDLRLSAARAHKHCSAYQFVSPGSLRLHVVLFFSVCFLSGGFPPRLATTVFGNLFGHLFYTFLPPFCLVFQNSHNFPAKGGTGSTCSFCFCIIYSCAEAGLDMSACGAGDRRISALKKYDECSLFFLRVQRQRPTMALYLVEIIYPSTCIAYPRKDYLSLFIRREGGDSKK